MSFFSNFLILLFCETSIFQIDFHLFQLIFQLITVPLHLMKYLALVEVSPLTHFASLKPNLDQWLIALLFESIFDASKQRNTASI